jgi:hypothetical protein
LEQDINTSPLRNFFKRPHKQQIQPSRTEKTTSNGKRKNTSEREEKPRKEGRPKKKEHGKTEHPEVIHRIEQRRLEEEPLVSLQGKVRKKKKKATLQTKHKGKARNNIAKRDHRRKNQNGHWEAPRGLQQEKHWKPKFCRQAGGWAQR